MPVVLQYKGYRVFFFSAEGNPREPIHVHVKKGNKRAKYWVEPAVALEYAIDMNISEQKELARVIVTNRERIREAWHGHFGE